MVVTMALPMTEKAHYSPTAAAENERVMDNYRARNAEMLATIARLTNVPTAITMGYMYIESECGGLDTRPKSPFGAVGDMQIDSETATDTLVREISRGRMSQEDADYCQQYLGATYEKIVRTKPQRGVISQKQLMQRPFNVYVATLFLGQLLDANTENGVVRMDKVLVLYNRGVNSHPQGRNADEIIAWALKRWPGKKGRITAAYVAKLVGKNGLLTTTLKS